MSEDSYAGHMRPFDIPKDTRLWKMWDEKADKNGERATVFWNGGTRYKGEWKNNIKDGKGTLSFPNGDKYEGFFANGKRSGQGTYWLYDKAKDNFRVQYHGEWLHGKKHGYGVFYNEKGERYEGQWVANKRHGKGRQTYGGRVPDGLGGDLYEGEWEADKRCGEGVLHLRNGDVFQGQWRDDMKHGEGVFFYHATGNRYDGVWEAGVAKCGTYAPTDPQSVPRLPVTELAAPEGVVETATKLALRKANQPKPFP
eukprot:CAMPEP_0170138566 /NCGR_PEP_ID=MMETSP0033_2-20121228/5017_1 /TAXON_ID=195969 /ORGANISM="Dolichomastix tenuilepis, Strain CCMP3274" /LENGTH=253 /DNA_ID=CAMNT_0010374589 /DNA_START=18 /DNA_END=779 /DNA_ORIENTATION=-